MRRSRTALGSPWLWFGLLGGAVAWGIQLGTNYLIASLACPAPGGSPVGDPDLPMIAVSIATGAAALAATAVSIAILGRVRSARDGEGRDVGAEGRPVLFLATSGAVLSGLFFLVIVLAATANVLSPACP